LTATAQPEPRSTSRRALLAGAIGGIGALAATVIGRAAPVRAVDGQAVVVGGEYTGSSATGFQTTDTLALYGDSVSQVGVAGGSHSNSGVFGHSTTEIGVYGRSTANVHPALLGLTVGNSTGVQGFSAATDLPPPAAKPKTGVYGYAAQDSSSFGVVGESPAGIGVYGSSNTSFGGYFAGKVYTTKWYELGEVATPAAPGANKARLFVRDNGAGKTQLCVRFATGTVKVLATEG
jgi:hypothetical protein